MILRLLAAGYFGIWIGIATQVPDKLMRVTKPGDKFGIDTALTLILLTALPLAIGFMAGRESKP